MKIRNILLSTALVGSLASCNMDERYFSQVTPDNFVESETNIYQLLSRPFGHWQAFVKSHMFNANEMTSDEFICPARTTGDWYNGGEYMARHYHTMDWQDGYADTNWKEAMQGIARCLTVIEQVNATNYAALNMTEDDRARHLAQVQALSAYFYMIGMDWFGGLPIYESTSDPLRPRNTVKETFDHTESLLKIAISNLPKRESINQQVDGYLTSGAAAMLLAELYFNAESYIGVQMFDECAKICEDIINGVYGPYELESDWRDVFGFDNHYSTEVLWGVPADYALQKNNAQVNNFCPYLIYKYLGISTGFPNGNWNGACLAPSRDPQNRKYIDTNPEIKLGSPYEKFDDGDLRKKCYRYLGNKEFEGMFFIGKLQDPDHPERACTNNRNYQMGEISVIVDRIAPYSQVKGYAESEANVKYQTLAEVPSTMYYCAEENDGVRLVKTPYPDESDYKLYGTMCVPHVRLTETYYTLAECKLRAGKKQEAADLINAVRKRNFANGADPNPVTASNLDKYRMLDEWMIEFLGEGRRRIDLIRWGVYHTEKWWDHEPTNDPKVCRLPVGDSVIGSNNLLKQNPGYGGDELSPEEV